MVQVILDTNIYGKIAIDPEREQLVERIVNSHLVVMNLSLIREELRRTARSRKVERGRKLRSLLLSLYEQIVARRVIRPNCETTRLAEQFYKEYRQRGGNVGRKRILTDFRIMACAALHGCDVVVTDDQRTMKGTKAVAAYRAVTLAQNLRPPSFLSYRALKESVRLQL